MKRNVMASAIEPKIWNSIAAALKNPTLIATEVEKLRTDAAANQTALDHQQEQYLRQLAACAEERQLAQDAYYAKAIKLHDFKAKQEQLDMRQKSAEDALATLKQGQRLIDKTQQYAVALSEYYTRVRQKFQRFDLEEKHLALEALGITVFWYPDRQPEIQSNIPIVIDDNASRCIVPPPPSA